MNRREFLTTASAGSLVAVAGCAGSSVEYEYVETQNPPDIEYDVEFDYRHNTLTLTHAGGDPVTQPHTYYLQGHDTETVPKPSTNNEIVRRGDELVTFKNVPKITPGDVYWVRDANTPDELSMGSDATETEAARRVTSVDWGSPRTSPRPNAQYHVELVDDISEYSHLKKSGDGAQTAITGPGVVLRHGGGQSIQEESEYELAGKHVTVGGTVQTGDVVVVFPVTLTEIEELNAERRRERGGELRVDASDVHWVGDDGSLTVVANVINKGDGERIGDTITIR